jgi:hypothetical protein
MEKEKEENSAYTLQVQKNSMCHIGRIYLNHILKIYEQGRIDVSNSRIKICMSTCGYRLAERDPRFLGGME